MSANKKPIDEATAEELRIFAMVNLGLEVTGTENRNVMMNKLKTAGIEPEFIVLHPKAQKVNSKNSSDDGVKVIKGEKHFSITVATLPGVGGARAIPLRVNGANFIMPRGKPHWVPEKYVEALQNAVGLEYDPTEDGGLSEPREVLSYPFNRVSGAPDTEKVA